MVHLSDNARFLIPRLGPVHEEEMDGEQCLVLEKPLLVLHKPSGTQMEVVALQGCYVHIAGKGRYVLDVFRFD
jgi:hypothetical protein